MDPLIFYLNELQFITTNNDVSYITLTKPKSVVQCAKLCKYGGGFVIVIYEISLWVVINCSLFR
jgi:hypothetical protein